MVAPGDYDNDHFTYLAAEATLVRNEADLMRIKLHLGGGQDVAAPRSSWPRARSMRSRSTSNA